MTQRKLRDQFYEPDGEKPKIPLGSNSCKCGNFATVLESRVDFHYPTKTATRRVIFFCLKCANTFEKDLESWKFIP